MEDRQYMPFCKNFENIIKIIELIPCVAYETGIPGYRDVTSWPAIPGYRGEMVKYND